MYQNVPPPPYQKAGYATVASFRSPEEWPNEDGRFRPPPPTRYTKSPPLLLLIGVQDEFNSWGGGGGGGPEVSCPNIFPSVCPKIKWFYNLSQISTCVFARNGHLKISGGGLRPRGGGGGGTHVYWQYRYVRPLRPLFTPCQPFQSISFSLPDVQSISFSLTNPFLWYAVEISVLKTPISC